MERMLFSTFRTTLKQIKEVRKMFFSNESLEKYNERFRLNYVLRIKNGKLQEFFHLIEGHDAIETICEEEKQQAFFTHMMNFYHIFHNETMDTKIGAYYYLEKVFNKDKNEKLYFTHNKDKMEFQLIDRETDFYCEVVWEDGKFVQLKPSYENKEESYVKEFKIYKKEFEKEITELLEKFEQINKKQRIRKLLKTI
jgi:hypothetical protein